MSFASYLLEDGYRGRKAAVYFLVVWYGVFSVEVCAFRYDSVRLVHYRMSKWCTIF